MQFARTAKIPRRSVATVLLALLLPLQAFADAVTTLASNRVRLTQAEIEALGFVAQFEPALPTDQITALYLIFPERIDGRKFIDATAELVDINGTADKAELAMARNQTAAKVLVIKALDPTRIITIEFVLQYGADIQYEVSIDVASLNMAR
jgi:hypothetical protein